jgi:putative nucleotidyltransferase with HDIG domain
VSYELKEVKIHVSQLALGMNVVRLDIPWEQTEFLLQGFVINHVGEIEALQDCCEHVYIEAKLHHKPVIDVPKNDPDSTSIYSRVVKKEPDPKAVSTGKGKVYKERHSVDDQKTRLTYINKIDVTREMVNARTSYDAARDLAKDIMSGIRMGRTIDMHQARAVVDDCVESVLRNGDALLLLTKLKDQHAYTAEHCLNVCILAATFARHLGLLEDEIRKLALCGLLHDIGKSRVPAVILEKPSSLTPEEFRLVQDHAVFGRDILMGVSKVDHATVDVAYNHHERMDGSGYPRGIKSSQIPYFAKVIAVCDTYDAITSNRIYDKGRASMEALDIIHRGKGGQFDEELAKEFIRCIGIYPPGSIVVLSGGEVGIVIASNPKNKLRPQVLLVRDQNKAKREKYRMIDLIVNPTDPEGNVYNLVKEVPDGTYGVDLKTFLRKGLVLSAPLIYES